MRSQYKVKTLPSWGGSRVFTLYCDLIFFMVGRKSAGLSWQPHAKNNRQQIDPDTKHDDHDRRRPSTSWSDLHGDRRANVRGPAEWRRCWSGSMQLLETHRPMAPSWMEWVGCGIPLALHPRF